jgi:hypothetical protein
MDSYLHEYPPPLRINPLGTDHVSWGGGKGLRLVTRVSCRVFRVL